VNQSDRLTALWVDLGIIPAVVLSGGPMLDSLLDALKSRLDRELKAFNFRNVLMGVARPIFWPIALGSVLAYCGSWHQLLELLTHFRLQYLLGALFTLVLYGFTQRRVEILVCLFCVALNAAPIVTWYFPAAAVAIDQPQALRVMVSNVLTKNQRYDDFVRYVQAAQPDVLVVMELDPIWQQQLTRLQSQLPHKLESPSDDNFGIAIYSRYPLQNPMTHDWADGPYAVPSLTANITVNQKAVSLVATHPLPPLKSEYFQYRNQQMIDMANYVKSQTVPTILMGDLNMSMWSPYYQKFVHDTKFKNTRQGFGVKPSWPANSPLLLIPIDHCLVSPSIAVVRHQVGPDIGSDHYPLLADLKI
jgi:endonuclease/exonuclease/phosphatase (EEP) superfamily protein YafD